MLQLKMTAQILWGTQVTNNQIQQLTAESSWHSGGQADLLTAQGFKAAQFSGVSRKTVE